MHGEDAVAVEEPSGQRRIVLDAGEAAQAERGDAAVQIGLIGREYLDTRQGTDGGNPAVA